MATNQEIVRHAKRALVDHSHETLLKLARPLFDVAARLVRNHPSPEAVEVLYHTANALKSITEDTTPGMDHDRKQIAIDRLRHAAIVVGQILVMRGSTPESVSAD